MEIREHPLLLEHIFLELNAYDQYVIDAFMQNMENVILLTVQNLLTKRTT